MRALALLAAVTLLRLGVAAVVPLAPDEAYYWVWSRTLQGGYLDHPPMVAWFIRAGTLLAGEGAFGIRLIGPISIAVASLLLARAADSLFPDRRPGLLAAALFNATLLVGVGGILVTPDLPLLVFWTAALWALARLHASQDGRWWLAFGVLSGLALLSKYTAGLLGIGVLAWLLASRQAWRWWSDWRLWAGGALAVLVFLPVVLWNAAHGWASFARQGGRAGADEAGFTLRYLGELVAAPPASHRRAGRAGDAAGLRAVRGGRCDGDAKLVARRRGGWSAGGPGAAGHRAVPVAGDRQPGAGQLASHPVPRRLHRRRSLPARPPGGLAAAGGGDRRGASAGGLYPGGLRTAAAAAPAGPDAGAPRRLARARRGGRGRAPADRRRLRGGGGIRAGGATRPSDASRRPGRGDRPEMELI
jgi:hypothetical protein